MSRALAGAVAASALALPLAMTSVPSSACSVCLAGDPQFSSLGTSSQEAGSFSLYLEALGFRKTADALPHGDEESAEGSEGHGDEHDDGHDHGEPGDGSHGDAHEQSRGQRYDLFASWTPFDRVTLTLDVPFVSNRITERGETSALAGLGDIAIASSVVLWRDRDVMPSTWLEGRLWLKTPTGRDDEEVDGQLDPHLQPGTGSWDFGAGLSAVHRRSWGSLYASAFYRENTPGALDYTYGDVFLANLAVEVPIGHALGRPAFDWLTAGLELNFRYAGYDHDDGQIYKSSGGSILYLAPALRVRLQRPVRRPWQVSPVHAPTGTLSEEPAPRVRSALLGGQARNSHPRPGPRQPGQAHAKAPGRARAPPLRPRPLASSPHAELRHR